MNIFKKLFSNEGKEKDPVCGMMVNTQTAQYKSAYQEKTYYFCSKNCLKQFQENIPAQNKKSCC